MRLVISAIKTSELSSRFSANHSFWLAVSLIPTLLSEALRGKIDLIDGVMRQRHQHSGAQWQ
jgi:hypothetical protein